MRVAAAASMVVSGWTPLPAPPFSASGGVSVWTGRELVHWSGETPAGGYAALGAAFDGRRWSRIPPGPLRPRAWAGSVWTGRFVFVWGGVVRDHAARRGATFDPSTRSWRLLRPAPLSPRMPVATVWTGREVVVWGDRSRSRAARDGAAYEPRRNRWRRLRAAPLALNEATGVWTGRELVVVGALLDGNNHARDGMARAIAYNPRRDRWRVLPAPRLSPQASFAVWTGSEVLAWDYELLARAYVPTTNAWRARPRVPLAFGECYPRGARAARFVLAWHCGQAAVFDTTRLAWQRVVGPRSAFAGVPVAVGNEFFVLGPKRLWSYGPR